MFLKFNCRGKRKKGEGEGFSVIPVARRTSGFK